MTDDTMITPLYQPGTVVDPLTEIAREGARRMLASALEAEVGAFLDGLAGERLPDGRRRVVRHGHGPEREIQELWLKPAPPDQAASPSFSHSSTPPPRHPTLVERAQLRLGRPWLWNRIFAEQIAAAAAEAVRRRGIEALVMEETWGWAAEVQARLAIPVVVALHGPWFLLRDLIAPGPPTRSDRARIAREAAAFAACAGVMATSRDVLERTLAAHPNIPPGPRTVIPNPIVAPEAGLDWEALGEEGRRRILFVGRFEALKGGDTVLAAFDALIRIGAEAQLTFVGPDRGLILPDGRRRDMAQALAVLPEATRSRIDWRGRLGRTEIAELRRGHAVAVMASRYETLGYAAIEAQAAGQALVATEVGGVPEIVRDGETGLLVPPGDPQALASACARLLHDPALASRLGAAAR